MKNRKKYFMYLCLFLSFFLCLPLNNLEAKASLDKPTHLTVAVKRDEKGEYSHIELSWTNPKSIQEYRKSHPGTQVQVDVKNNGDPWHLDGGKGLVVMPLEEGSKSKIILNENSFASIKEFNVFQSNYSFRLRYRDQENFSSFSSPVKIGLRPVLKNVSTWAQGPLTRGNKLGLIPSSVKEDLKAPISREEFAHALVLAYEYKHGEVAPLAKEAFRDAGQSYILKAKELGFITGIGNNSFNPKGHITREQMAVMTDKFYATLDGKNPGKDLVFQDEGKIAAWAKPSVHKMASTGFIKGYKGKFNPKEKTSREEGLSVIFRILELNK